MASRPSSTRLRFREYSLDDVEALAPVFADAYAARFYPQHSDPERLVSWIEWSCDSYRKHGFGLWALELLPGATFAGDAGLTLQPVEGELLLEIGYHIHPAPRGEGLATDAAEACLSWGFENTNHDVICSIVHPDNSASTHVAGRVHTAQREFESPTGPRLLLLTTRQEWVAARASR